MEKWLRCVAPSTEPHDPEAAWSAFRRDPAATQVVDLVGSDQDLLELHGMPPRLPVRFGLLCWEWLSTSPKAHASGESLYRITERPVFDELPKRDAAGWRPGVKQLSFLRRPLGVSRDEFRSLYAHHTEKLRADQPGIAKYVQNVVEECSPGALDLDGVSELWFASLEDFRERYWSGPGVAERESKETGRFLDFSRTWSMIVRERVPLD